MRKFFILLIICQIAAPFNETFAQVSEIDTLNHIRKNNDTLLFTPEIAAGYISALLDDQALWSEKGLDMKIALRRLLDHYKAPYDSVQKKLRQFSPNDIWLRQATLTQYDTFALRWLSPKLFFVDTIPLEKDPVLVKQTIIVRNLELDSAMMALIDSIPGLDEKMAALLLQKDTITERIIHYDYLQQNRVSLHRIENGKPSPPLLPAHSRKTARFLSDSTAIVLSERKRVTMADAASPFYIVPDYSLPDSLGLAINTLLAYSFERDSIRLSIVDANGRPTVFWLTSGKDDLRRYWVRNSQNDSITLWLGNPTKFEIKILLEEAVEIKRFEKQDIDNVPIMNVLPVRRLAIVTPLKEIPIYWKHGLNSSFTLNQNYLSNWARGGESSLSGLLDIDGRSIYTDKANKVQWTNTARFRFGTNRTKESGFRTSTDIIELNSKLNKEIRKKLDFSAVFYAKTQAAKGFNYPNDSVVVSKFFNPGTFTIGVGMEYKPFEKTLINFSMLSYKNTFVLDTANINQTIHGVEKDKRARQEMGGQLVIRNTLDIAKGLSMSNALRLFSNYIDNPQNVDVDWEIGIEKRINWYSTLRLNLHLIYDDDVRFPVFDDKGEPVLLPDGSPKKSPKLQLNQLLGLTLSMRI